MVGTHGLFWHDSLTGGRQAICFHGEAALRALRVHVAVGHGVLLLVVLAIVSLRTSKRGCAVCISSFGDRVGVPGETVGLVHLTFVSNVHGAGHVGMISTISTKDSLDLDPLRSTHHFETRCLLGKGLVRERTASSKDSREHCRDHRGDCGRGFALHLSLVQADSKMAVDAHGCRRANSTSNGSTARCDTLRGSLVGIPCRVKLFMRGRFGMCNSVLGIMSAGESGTGAVCVGLKCSSPVGRKLHFSMIRSNVLRKRGVRAGVNRVQVARVVKPGVSLYGIGGKNRAVLATLGRKGALGLVSERTGLFSRWRAVRGRCAAARPPAQRLPEPNNVAVSERATAFLW